MNRKRVCSKVCFRDIGLGTQENSLKRPKIDPGVVPWAVSQPANSNFFLNSLRILILVISTHMRNMKVGLLVRFRDIGLGTQENSVKRPKSGPSVVPWAVSQPVTSNFFSNSLRILVLVISTHMQNMRVGCRVRFRDIELVRNSGPDFGRFTLFPCVPSSILYPKRTR